MNTLGKTITEQFFVNKLTGFQELEKAWKALIADGFKPTTVELLTYAILRGKDYRKGFTPITNTVKLENGRAPYDTLWRSISQLKWKGAFATLPAADLQELLVDDIDKVLKQYLPGPDCSLYDWPLAYKEPASV